MTQCLPPQISDEAKSGGYSDAVVLGMGGSSLCPEVLSMTFGQHAGFPALHVLNSTDPAEVKAIETLADPKTTLYIVSNKLGSTLEPNIFKQYFFEKSGGRSGNAGSRFIAVTDPGSEMEQVAKADGFSRICYGVPSIGGRYSALSDFGTVPDAVAGLDIPRLLGNLPPESPILESDGMKFFTDACNAFQLQGTTAVELLRSHLNRLGAGDYFALLGYIQMNASHEEDLQKMRLDVRNKKRVATCLRFGPRFLHSTDQAYKGGPNSGVFQQITCDEAHDIPIPGQKFTFGTVKAAQARRRFRRPRGKAAAGIARPPAGGFKNGACNTGSSDHGGTKVNANRNGGSRQNGRQHVAPPGAWRA